MTFPPKVWDGVLRRLKDELAPFSYEMWIEKIVARPAGREDGPTVDGNKDGLLHAGSEGDGHGVGKGVRGGMRTGEDEHTREHEFEVLELVCPNRFHAVRIRDFFLKPISNCVQAELGRRVPLRVAVADESTPASAVSDVSVCATTPGRSAVPLTRPATSDTPSSAAHPATEPVRLHLPVAKRTENTQPLAQALGSLLGGEASAAKRSPGAAAADAAPSTAPETKPSARPGAATQAAVAGAPAAAASASAARSVPEPNPARRAIAARVVAQAAAAGAGGGSHLHPGLAPRQPTFPLTFEAFTVGPANALAREAAMALASQPASSNQLGLNQLFIVSGAGLGKTHLARAAVVEGARSIGARARYTTAETFTSEFTNAVRTDKMAGFKRRYRGECDLLVVDDVQFLEGKAATQLEFFHTVQHVLDGGGRVLLTGDRYPQELTHLDPRVRARISSGFVAEVAAPDPKLRSEILRAKAAHGGIRLPDDCVELLVEQVDGNVRELEGALIQLVTIASLFKRSIDLELTRESLDGRSRSLRLVSEPATTKVVIETVAGFFKTNPEALASRSRRRDVLVPRQIAMYLCRRFTDASLADIGRALNRDHPSVANAIRKIERQLLENVRLRYQVEAVIDRLKELGYRPLHTAD